MIITDIFPVDNKKKKIYIDYEYAFTLYNSEIRRYHLDINTELGINVQSSINEILTKRVKARILYLLKSADKTEKQLRDKLYENGYTNEYIDLAVEYAKSYGYIDDRRYAFNYVDSVYNTRSRNDIKGRLYMKGVSADIIEEVLSEYDFDEKPAIIKALRKKGLSEDNLSELEYNERNKIYAYLLRKGFNMKDINDSLRT